MLKGSIVLGNQPGMTFAIKIILVTAYPVRAPKVYIDQSLDSTIAKARSYIGL